MKHEMSVQSCKVNPDTQILHPTLSMYIFSLQRVCEQLHLYTIGQPEKVRATSVGD